MADWIAKDHVEFFKRVGDSYVHPKSWGDCIFPVSVEELYQHFKARLLEETTSPSASAEPK